MCCAPPPPSKPPSSSHLDSGVQSPVSGTARECTGGHTWVLCELQTASCVCMLPLHDVNKLVCSSQAEPAAVPSWLSGADFQIFAFLFRLPRAGFPAVADGDVSVVFPVHSAGRRL